MIKLRDALIFLAGAEFFHTLSHIILPYIVTLPLNMDFMILTPSLNKWVIIINAIITIALIWWASRIKVKS